MTNAEKIQSMSIEELADYISEFCDCGASNCPIHCMPINCGNGCKEAWLKYIAREVDE